MSYPIQVIPAKVCEHKTTGRRASIYGAHPASNKPGDMYSDWHVIQVGWTVRNSDETTGVCRPPWATKEAAEEFLKQHGRANHMLPTLDN